MNSISVNGIESISTMCAVFGDVLVAAVRDELVLDKNPGRYDIATDKIILLPFSARSGSTFATQLLSSHPAFGRVTDWFLPRQLEKLRLKGGRSHNQVVRLVLQSETCIAFSSKCIRESLISAAYLGIIDQFLDQITFFGIDRRDKVAQAVSFYKAQISGHFHSSQAARRTVTPDGFDFDQIYRHCRRFHRINEEFSSLLEAFGKPKQRFWYEDFTDDPGSFLETINRALDLSEGTGLNAEAQVQELGDAINTEWAVRFRETLATRASGQSS